MGSRQAPRGARFLGPVMPSERQRQGCVHSTDQPVVAEGSLATLGYATHEGRSYARTADTLALAYLVSGVATPTPTWLQRVKRSGAVLVHTADTLWVARIVSFPGALPIRRSPPLRTNGIACHRIYKRVHPHLRNHFHRDCMGKSMDWFTDRFSLTDSPFGPSACSLSRLRYYIWKRSMRFRVRQTPVQA